MKKYLYIETGEDGCGDLYISSRPLDETEYREIKLDDIEKAKDPFIGRNDEAKVKICISE